PDPRSDAGLLRPRKLQVARQPQSNRSIRTVMLRMFAAVVALALCFSATAADQIIVRNTIYFDPDNVQMGVVAKEIVHDLGAEIIRREFPRVVLVGHCATADKAPLLLSRYRAKAVADHLRASGVPATVTIEYKGVGSTQPAVKTGPNIRDPY